MLELAMHILDIVENSVNAGADEAIIRIEEDTEKDQLRIEIEDNGRGMSPVMSGRVVNPFSTTKKGKRVGLGLSLFQEAAEKSGGGMTIESGLGKGTVVRATFGLTHIDRQPLGDVVETMVTLIVGNPGVEFQLVCVKDGKSQAWDTGKIWDRFGAVPRSHPQVLEFIRSGIGGIQHGGR